MQLVFDLQPGDDRLFTDESLEQIERIEQGLLVLEHELDANVVNEVFRAAHTLKGSAATIGHRRMAELTHAMEDLFGAFRSGTLVDVKPFADVLLQTIDVLRDLVAEVQEGEVLTDAPEELTKRLRELLSSATATAAARSTAPKPTPRQAPPPVQFPAAHPAGATAAGRSGPADEAGDQAVPTGEAALDWLSREPRRTVVHRRFSPRRDAMLDQHRLAGTSLMPGVGFMEMMAESHALLTGQQEGALVFRQVEFSDGFKLYRDQARDVQVRIAAAAPGVVNGRSLSMEVWSPFQSQARSVAEDRLYCRAQVTREQVAMPAESPADWPLGGDERTTYADMLAKSAGMKQNVRFGPLFNDAQRPGHSPEESAIVHGVSGIWARAPLPKAQLAEPRYPLARFQVNHAFLDSMHQAGALFAIRLTGRIFLPVGADEFVIFAPLNQDGHYDVFAKIVKQTEDRFWYDIALLRDRKDLCCLAKNVVFRRIEQ